jgi:uncharacterized repeat protein (TIGR02543 family)
MEARLKTQKFKVGSNAMSLIKLHTFCLLLLLFQINVKAQWVRKADGLKPRSELGETIVYNSKLYTFVGFSDTARHAEPTSEVYNPSTNKWSYLASMPANTAMTHQDVVLVDNTIWHIGGRVGQNPGPMSSLIWIYNISTNSWSKGPEIRDPATGTPMVIAASGSVLLGRTLHIFGGFTPTACNGDQDKYHLTLDVDSWLANPSLPARWENKLKPLPLKRNHLSTAVLGGKIYAIGGQLGHDCGGGPDVAYFHVYNPSTDTWTQLPSPPTARSHAEGSTFTIDGKIYVVGGQGTDDKSTKYVTTFDPAGNNGVGKWTEITSLTLPYIYEGLSAKVIGTTFIISHGSQGTSRYPKKLTYSRTITRYPVYKLGFPSECLNLNDSSASSLKGHTWLFTIDGTKTYTTSSNAAWLVVSKNATGTAVPNAVDIEVTADPSGLAPGTYTATVTATGTGSGIAYSSAALCVKLTVEDQTQPGQYNLIVNTNGSGTVTKNPDQSSYDSETDVTLTATPASDEEFTGWSGDLTGTTNPVTITMNSNKTITANFTSSDLITDISANTGRSYTLGELTVGTALYTDRTYQATSVPAFLNNAPFIKTPNDDKGNKSTSMLSFNLTQNATVYIAYDPRATSLPAWMSGWQKLTSKLGLNDSKITYLELYSKSFSAGAITLGGNLASPAAGALNNYIVIALPQQSLQRSANGTLVANNSLETEIRKSQNKILDFRIYPNPGDGNKVFIESNSFPKNEMITVTVHDMVGKLVQSIKIFTGEYGELKKNIILNKSLKKGMYTVTLNSSFGNSQKKLIVN